MSGLAQIGGALADRQQYAEIAAAMRDLLREIKALRHELEAARRAGAKHDVR